jgi:nicotinate-nucleotide pyrophosphorylase (carboxylating)
MPKRSEFHAFLDEDVGRGDITSELVVPRGERADAVIVAKEACVVAGLDEAHTLFEELAVDFAPAVADGSLVPRGTVVARLAGKARSILKGERVALNIIQRMSGIATLTSSMLAKGRAANANLVLAATRKTTPGFRAFEKRAVSLGGGAPHRFALDDMVLVKDNHAAIAGSVSEAVRRVASQRGASFTRKVEVEASTLKDALAAAELGADIVMLDNFPLSKLKTAYRELKRRYPRVLVEVSGGIDERTVARVAPFADIVSSGALTHSARACDFSLEVRPKKASGRGRSPTKRSKEARRP